eukprot:TRINITY_DN7375_c0_g1_i1.p1 TRINITY_DN7375_c0_g1~~TRINITY_DN7375_c0_g1_i1.p1  ORF type:complete len:426 (-),score=71.02 TRINITY_DN7375_c0_g1_i1:81-1358(-)
MSHQITEHPTQCAGISQRTRQRCSNQALTSLNTIYCSRHFHLDNSGALMKCRGRNVSQNEKNCNEVVLKRFEVCYKHFYLYLERLSSFPPQDVELSQTVGFLNQEISTLQRRLDNLSDKDSSLHSQLSKSHRKYLSMRVQTLQKLKEIRSPTLETLEHPSGVSDLSQIAPLSSGSLRTFSGPLTPTAPLPSSSPSSPSLGSSYSSSCEEIDATTFVSVQNQDSHGISPSSVSPHPSSPLSSSFSSMTIESPVTTLSSCNAQPFSVDSKQLKGASIPEHIWTPCVTLEQRSSCGQASDSFETVGTTPSSFSLEALQIGVSTSKTNIEISRSAPLLSSPPLPIWPAACISPSFSAPAGFHTFEPFHSPLKTSLPRTDIDLNYFYHSSNTSFFSPTTLEECLELPPAEILQGCPLVIPQNEAPHRDQT